MGGVGLEPFETILLTKSAVLPARTAAGLHMELGDRSRQPLGLSLLRSALDHGNPSMVRLLRDHGAEQVLCLPFNDALRSLTAQQFVERVLIEGLQVRHLVVGDDFRFGCDRAGDFQRTGDGDRLMPMPHRLDRRAVADAADFRRNRHQVAAEISSAMRRAAPTGSSDRVMGRPMTR